MPAGCSFDHKQQNAKDITVSLPSPLWITLRACSQELTSCSSKPTTWIWWSWAQKEQAKCLTNTFQPVIRTTANSFQADNMDLMILNMNRTSRVSDKHISVSDMCNRLFISGQPQMHLSHNIIRATTCYFILRTHPTTWIWWSQV